MSTATDTQHDVLGQLGESVERAASLLAGGSRLAGPAAAQDDASDLLPGDDGAGLAITFEDGSVVTVFLVPELVAELCGGTSADDVTSGLQVVTDEVSAGRSVGLAGVQTLMGSAMLLAALEGRDAILGAGIFDGDDVVATVGAAPGQPGATTPPAPAEPPAAEATAPAPEAAAPAPTAPAPSPAAPAAPRAVTPAAGRPPGPAVSDDLLARGLALLADVSLEVTAELGRSHLRVSELLALEPGAVIGLERAAGSPVDLLVNGSLFARAEVIVDDGAYAVRIVELVGTEISP